jgi:hypothetical protein
MCLAVLHPASNFATEPSNIGFVRRAHDAALFGGSASSPVAQPAPHGVTETVEALIATG